MRGLISARRPSRLFVAAIVACAVVLAAGCGGEGGAARGEQEEGGPFRVGVVLPFTGTLSFYGQEYRRGFDLAARKINADGGIDGRQLKLVYSNGPTQSASTDAVRGFNAKGIKVYTGTGSSTFDLADSTLGERLGMVTWAVLSLDTQLTSRGYKYTIQAGPHTQTFIKPSLEILKTMPERVGVNPSELKVALISSNDAYGQSNAAAQKKAIKAMGADLVLEQTYDKVATDLTPVVERIRAAGPHVVLQTGYTDDVVLMWRDAKSLGYAPPYFIGSGGTVATNFEEALSGFSNDFIGYSYSMATPEIEGSMEFLEAYREQYGEEPPSGHSLGAYAGIFKLADALAAAGTDDPDALVEAAKGLDQPVGSYPDGCGLKLTNTGRNTRCGAAGFQWQEGELVTVYPEQFAEEEIIGPIPASR
ncbi:MAG: ABC transporter substrate-binding protein [Solirubrobacteraceae bacterium]